MQTRLAQCARCGAELDAASGQCRSCPAPLVPGMAAAGAEGSAENEAAAAERARVFGLLLFDAEEQLARGAPDKALVLSSRAVKERPDSLTARALAERARRELLRGRRREKLEARIRQAQRLLEASDFPAAERIVVSALKLLPDHALALELFGRLRDRRLAPGTAEAQAERELERMGRAQARQALAAARRALAGGWERKAMLEVRRGLRFVPDHPELLALLRDVQHSLAGLDAERARRRALHGQIRAGLELSTHGRLTDSLKILRAVLREHPDNARAQAAIQQVRQLWLGRRPQAADAAPAAPAIRPRGKLAPAPARDDADTAPPPRIDPAAAARIATRARRAGPPPDVALAMRRRSTRTPLGLIVLGALILAALVGLWRTTPSARPSPSPVVVRSKPQATATPGPLETIDPELRQVIQMTLADYAHALETGDERLLGRVRPDLSDVERARAIAPFVGALNAATDLRVLEVVVHGGEVVVPVLRTDVIVRTRGEGSSGQPRQEELRFERRDGVWVLR